MTPIQTRRMLIALSFLALFVGLISVNPPFKTFGTAKSDDPVVATVGNRSITLREVEQAVALPLYLADQQRNQLLQQATQNLINEELLAAEASKKGISVPQLLDEASQSESIARLANLPVPVKRLSPSPTREDKGTSLDTQEQVRIRQALLVFLRRKTDIHMTLPNLEPPILAVSTDDNPSLGPDHAPITIVEFSDFQCPYCQQSVRILKQLRDMYGEKIRLVYRDYPGPNHPYAPQAAEAARCAGEQGRFWEYHDLLFGRQSPGKGWDFVALAKELGLQLNVFDSCLNSGRFREEITKDLQDGLKLGIASTPTFFINGRPLVGAQPLSTFQALIDRVLQEEPRS
jgi:protein-disulfide isomerase